MTRITSTIIVFSRHGDNHVTDLDLQCSMSMVYSVLDSSRHILYINGIVSSISQSRSRRNHAAVEFLLLFSPSASVMSSGILSTTVGGSPNYYALRAAPGPVKELPFFPFFLFINLLSTTISKSHHASSPPSPTRR